MKSKMEASPQLSIPPTESNPPKTVTEPIPTAMLDGLRAKHEEIEGLKDTIGAILSGYMAAKGWLTDTHEVDFNIGTGIVTSTER